MIQIEDGDYIVGFWFAYDNHGNDWMAYVRKPKNSKLFEGAYRFRDRVDEKLDHTSQDKKRWFYFRSRSEDETEKQIIDRMITAQLTVQDRYPKIDFMLVQGGLDIMMEKSKNHDWMHVQKMTTEEAKSKGLL